MKTQFKVRNVQVMSVSLEKLFEVAMDNCNPTAMPSDAQIVSASLDTLTNTIQMKLSSDSFAEILEGDGIPVFHLRIKNKTEPSP